MGLALKYLDATRERLMDLFLRPQAAAGLDYTRRLPSLLHYHV